MPITFSKKQKLVKMNATKKISLLIYEDNADLRKSLEILVKNMPEVDLKGSFSNCTEAEKHMRQYEPDLVLMDIDMPGITGVEGVKIIKKVRAQTLIIMLTVFEDNDRIFQSIKNGANGYLLKSTSPEKIQNAICEVMEGGAPMTPKIAKQVIEMFTLRTIGNASNDFKLTDKEKEVLSLLVKGRSYKMVGFDLNISIDTVRSHIRKIYEKLHVNSATEAVTTAIKHGLT